MTRKQQRQIEMAIEPWLSYRDVISAGSYNNTLWHHIWKDHECAALLSFRAQLHVTEHV